MSSSDPYGESTAYHYAVYRPELHALILKKCLGAEDTFKLGLDVGCGTGRSSIPLAKYCNELIAIDPSAEMISQAHPHPKVSYKHMGGNLDIPHNLYDVITFAGSLYYCKSQSLLDKLITYCVPDAIILVYDFQLHFDRILEELNFHVPAEVSEYNHDEGFSYLQAEHVTEVFCKKETITYPITTSNLAHFLLSHESIYQACKSSCRNGLLHPYLTAKLAHLPNNMVNALQTDLYYKKYRIDKI